MKGIEQLPVAPLEQAGNAIGAVSLGMPMVRGGNNPFSRPGMFIESENISEWQPLGLCSQTDPEVFFPEKGGSTRSAKEVCNSCEVKPQCLKYALDNDERFGIWGGTSERDRRKLRKQYR